MQHEHNLRPRRETAETKAETTKRISQEMTQTEAEIREAKTMRLRAARLAMQENQPAPAAPRKRTRKPKASTGSRN
ncbi:hypothetical protein [Roseibium sp.]|uniref:hypothetical protein n=1 Tax=Roseibium sp. TaxID=1936156 RepID=UPI003D0A1404